MRDERGDTLLEVVISLVLIGLVVGAYFATYQTTSGNSTTQRNLVTADGVLRSYAEATKAAAREQCATQPTYSVTSYTPPTGYTVNPLTNQTCPSPTAGDSASNPPVHLQVTLAGGLTKSFDIVVRTS
jgi:type II secretory pathway pseudopilin PulG